MASLNSVTLMGNLTRDPDVRYTPSGTAVANLGLALSHRWFDKATNQHKEETTFVDITAWGRQAEVAGEYLSKGRQVLIQGRLQLEQWEDQQSGNRRSKLSVVAEKLILIGGNGGGGQQQRQQQGAANSLPPAPQDSYYEGDIPGGDDVPF